MAAVIGLDFGNYNSFPCFIPSFDPDSRISGTVQTLLSEKNRFGIPSVYFYSSEKGEICGASALKPGARPVENRLRYLKRNLYQQVTLDGRKITYGEAITALIQHIVRTANEELKKSWLVTTNLIFLAYPCSYTAADRSYLIALAEQATLEDGTPVKVWGTIAEPAAAALDYLSRDNQAGKDTTVLTYDLGGGTFDLALVSAHPRGIRRKDGSLYYYQVLATDGLGDVGGVDFDKVVYRYALEQAKSQPGSAARKRLQRDCESYKIDLSSQESTQIVIDSDDGYEEISLSRKQFEALAAPLLRKTVALTAAFLKQHPAQKPDLILLTGGASQMPMVASAIQAALPQYRVIPYRPNLSIACGAARYGTAEPDSDAQAGSGVIRQTLPRSLGIRYLDPVKGKRYVETVIPAGTEIPYQGKFMTSYTSRDNQTRSSFLVYEARQELPDPYDLQQYRQVLSVTLHYGKPRPINYQTAVSLGISRQGVLTVTARDDHPDAPDTAANSIALESLH